MKLTQEELRIIYKSLRDRYANIYRWVDDKTLDEIENVIIRIDKQINWEKDEIKWKVGN